MGRLVARGPWGRELGQEQEHIHGDAGLAQPDDLSSAGTCECGRARVRSMQARAREGAGLAQPDDLCSARSRA